MKPGATTRSEASITRSAPVPMRPTSTILPACTATSARYAGAPVPSTTVPFRISRSVPIASSLGLERRAAAYTPRARAGGTLGSAAPGRRRGVGMHVGMSLFLQGRRDGISDAEVYAQETQLGDRAEPLGFDSLWS